MPSNPERESRQRFHGPALYHFFNTTELQRFGEFSVSSPANLEAWHREIPPASQWPLDNLDDPILYRKKALGMFTPRTWLNKHLADERFGRLDDLSSVIQAGQFLSAEQWRYAIDALRRKGTALPGGFMSWVYNEPWPNAAGANLVDYDGRPLMNYDFFRQALAPVSLSLQYDSVLDPLGSGVKAERRFAAGQERHRSSGEERRLVIVGCRRSHPVIPRHSSPC